MVQKLFGQHRQTDVSETFTFPHTLAVKMGIKRGGDDVYDKRMIRVRTEKKSK